MFLKTRVFVSPSYINISKRLLSNEIKEVLKTRLDPPSGTNGSQLQLSVLSKNLNAVNLDLFVNNIGPHEDRSSDVIDLLASLRSTKLANTCLDSTHFAVIGHLLENLTIQEVVTVLLDRLKYGIFLNNFTGFAVTQTLYEEKEYLLALPLALKLVLAEEVDSKFIGVFCLKASLESLKNESFDNNSSSKETPSTPKTKVQEKKIRVKFIRNVSEPDVHYEIGKAILKIGTKFLEGSTKENATILGLVLTKNFLELDKALSVNSIKISEDVADICKKFLSSENQEELAKKISNLQSQISFGPTVDNLLLETSVQEATIFAEQQKLLFPVWQQLRTEKQIELEKELSNKARKETVEVIGKEIATKREQLWFFENEEKLDLEISNKQVFYPKRWFGKKKKPRVVDEHYVPPQIRKIN